MQDNKTETLTLEQFVEIGETLELCGNIIGLEISYQVGKNLQKMRPEMKKISIERDAIRDKFVEKHPDGRPVIVEDPTGRNQPRLKITDEKAFNTALEVLGDCEIEWSFHKINHNDYPESVWAKLKGGYIATLLNYIVVEEPALKTAK